MDMIVPLQVAICLAFVFAMFSLMVTAVQELIASAVKLRARTFVSGLRQLLGAQDGTAPDGSGIVSFALGSLEGSDLFKDIVHHPVIQAGSTRRLPTYASAHSFTVAALDILSKGQSLTVANVEAAIGNLPAGRTKEALSALLKQADGDLGAFRTVLATWFDDAMDRVSGTYKRWSQAIGLVLGLMLSAALNVDTIRITKALWSDADLRRIVMAAADEADAKAKAGQDAGPDAARAREILAGLPLPIGYPSERGGNAGLTLVGWVITAIAASFGAPFWFDALQRLANLRGAGPKPARADEKA